MKKNLIIIGAGVEACEGIKIAKSMDLGLIVADGNPQAPGFALADHVLLVSTYDGDSIANAAMALVRSGVPVHGVIAMCADVPMSVAKVARMLGLPGLSLQSAHWVADKLAMKEQLQKTGIPIPRFAAVSENGLLEAAQAIGFPLVIKPVDSRGARGVQLLDRPEQLPKAYRLAKQESPTGRVMLEEYLAGPQFSTETLIDDGHCYTLGFADRNYEWLANTRPFMIENGGDSPTCVSADIKAAVVDTVEKAALALGISSGVAKGDMVYTAEGAKVIEIAGRLSGGYFSTTQIPLSSGVNFIEQAIKLALGERLLLEDVTPSQERGVAIRYLSLPAGIVQSVEGVEQAQSAPGVELLSVFVHAGDTISDVKNHTQRGGFVICSANTKQEAIERASYALSMIRVVYESQ